MIGNDELLAQIRNRAFEGMVMTAMIGTNPLKPLLTEHFAAILKAIDASTSTVMGDRLSTEELMGLLDQLGAQHG